MKSANAAIKYIYSFMLKRKWFIPLFIFMCIFRVVFGIIEPRIAQDLIDTAVYSHEVHLLLRYALFWSIAFIIRMLVELSYKYTSIKYRNGILSSIIEDVFRHVLKLPIGYFQDNSPTYIVSRQIDDAFGIQGLMVNNLIEGVLSIIEFIVIAILMFRYNILLGIISILLIALDLLITFSFPLTRLYKEHNESLAVIKKELANVYQGVKLIKLQDNIEQETTRFKEYQDRYFEALAKRDHANLLRNSSTSFLKDIGIPIIVIVSSYYIFKGEMTAGLVTSIMLYYNRLWKASIPATNLIPLYKIGKASAERLFEILQYPTENDIEGTKMSTIEGEIDSISFRNVDLCYIDNVNVLKNINLDINKGRSIAFVGHSGSGKSSIINLLLKFFAASSGNIIINGIDINDIDAISLRKHFSYVDQQAFLFNRTIRENLLYYCKCKNNKETHDKLDYYIDVFGLTEFISKLPNGIDTKLNESSSKISGGEKQRLCIIRELMKDSEILILDEYTSALDSITQLGIHNELLKLSKDKTIIMIAHRLTTIVNVDHIFVLEQGAIVENGTHSELMKTGGRYFDLFTKQVTFEED
ncbi:ABC transporter ATP-binding protein [Proteiniborus sp. MB09-C3]|uniref:ABC transporter ATP-binding protein n=1 Tax=Proteiniborus sp. MB09-C3 TaxID=3050072 RepID=UPI0025537376|nr:ABC transporter ATP-binding protein [Proteiniborus sp. MB09-C3]WIV13370.1 ABC transporter ATP-binding protein [Proteiniborus sp. MB09-C3]